MGAGQFGPKGLDWYQHFFNHPNRMSELFSYFCELGFPGAQVIGYSTIVEAARQSQQQHSMKVAVSLLPEDWMQNLRDVQVLEPEVIFVHGAMTDEFLLNRGDELVACCDAIREVGAFPGISTHNPYETLTHILSDSSHFGSESIGLLLPLNPKGWGLGAEISAISKLVMQLDQRNPIMAMKVLAAGRIQPEEALSWLYETVNPTIAAIGVTNKEEAQELASTVNNLL